MSKEVSGVNFVRLQLCRRAGVTHTVMAVSTLASMLAVAITLLAPTSARAQQRDSTVRDSTARTQQAQNIEGVTVRAIRSTDQPPIAEKTLDRAMLMERNFGQDVPLLLQSASPSLSVHTETGTNWGYSHLRLRGMDQTRINITLDGVPLNDPEDQVLYFANFTDLLANVRSVQVQRGVGTSTNGTAAFAGSLNFETMPIARRNASGSVEVQAGSYGAQRVSGSFNSGLHNRLAFYGRAGAVRTNGYRDHSGVEGKSGFAGVGYFGDRNIIKLSALAGLLMDTLAYEGATLDELAVNRRYNPLAPDERDRFGQQMLALSWTRIVSENSSINTTVYRNSASGEYDFFWDQDRYSYGLSHIWYGATVALNRTAAGGRARINAGANVNDYERTHRAWLRPDPAYLYSNTGHKNDASAFVKLSYDATPAVRLFGDLQTRYAYFRYEPDANAGIDERDIHWTFLNPRGGITWQLAPAWSLFASFGSTGREPARSDLFAGEDDLNEYNVAEIGDLSRIKPERVYDTEAGIAFRNSRSEVNANLYYMAFPDMIAPIGTPMASGSIPRKSVGASVRSGVESDVTIHATEQLTLSGTLAWNYSRINRFIDSSGDVPQVFNNVQPMLSPELITTHRVDYQPRTGFALIAEGRYQSKAYLDNTGNSAHVLPDMYGLDLATRANWSRYTLTLRAANVGDTQKFGSGSVSYGVARYFVLPPRSFYLTLSTDF